MASSSAHLQLPLNFMLFLPLLVLAAINFRVVDGGVLTNIKAGAVGSTLTKSFRRTTAHHHDHAKAAGIRFPPSIPNNVHFAGNGGAISGFANRLLNKQNLSIQKGSTMSPLQALSIDLQNETESPFTHSEVHNKRQKSPIQNIHFPSADEFSKADIMKMLIKKYSQALAENGLSNPYRQEIFLNEYLRELVASNKQLDNNTISNESKLDKDFNAYIEERVCYLLYERTLTENNITDEEEEQAFDRHLCMVLEDEHGLTCGKVILDKAHLLTFRVALAQTLTDRAVQQKCAQILTPICEEYRISHWMTQMAYVDFFHSMFKSVDAVKVEQIDLSAVQTQLINDINVEEEVLKLRTIMAAKLEKAVRTESEGSIELAELDEMFQEALDEYLEQKSWQDYVKLIFKAKLQEVSMWKLKSVE